MAATWLAIVAAMSMQAQVQMHDTGPNLANVPEVSVGMPVYNGERYLQASLDSLLAQTFADFELIISDNASTDRTEDICREYAARDKRIRYVRHPKNLGAAFNWNYVAEDASGTYFKWASSNDICASTMLERCVAVLRNDPSVVLCYGRTELIDDHGESIGIFGGDIDVSNALPSDRFIRVHNELMLNNAQSGLIRLSALRATRGERVYPTGDMTLMAELALYGGFRLLQERLLLRRMDKKSSARFLSNGELARFLRPQGGGLSLPIFRRFADYYWSVLRSRIGVREKLRAVRAVTRWAIWERHKLYADVTSLFVRD